VKILSVEAENFASIKQAKFNITNSGLTLIQGDTGSGKSTLCDLIPWGLFGVTAKGGVVTDVLSWPGNEVTKVVVLLDNMIICRTRGPKTKDNDLYFTKGTESDFTRGKDIQDTQKLINSIIGFDAELYLAGAYYHEFSQIAQFFTANAKNRRQICEQLVDLSLAKKLTQRRLEESTVKNKKLTELTQSIAILSSNINVLKQKQELENTRYATWENVKINRLANLQQQIKAWDLAHNTKLSSLKIKASEFKNETKCPTCGSHIDKKLHNPYIEQIDIESTKENPYYIQMLNIDAENNPYEEAAKDYSNGIAIKEIELKEKQYSNQILSNEINELDALQQIIEDYRSTSIVNAISSIETETNSLLTEYFDGEIKIQFEVAEADKINVNIQKDGNLANFTQLSKGQRGLLKLCFGVSVMNAVQNHHGVNMSMVWFDEALDGLSDALKLKAVSMLGRLTQYESVFFIEHSESVKAMIVNKYNVELVNGYSQIEKI
jgi:DNA repair exonuclease SbcCD ATPase subunit